MLIENNKDLTNLNTFKIAATAKYFVEIQSVEQLTELVETDIFKNNKRFILGGGSNILFTKDFDGLVIKINIKGKKVIKEDTESVLVEFGAGENWDKAVEYTVNQGFSGIENLSLIPGDVGASAVQNIGAYGTETKDTINSVEIFNLQTFKVQILTNNECKFAYRGSVFKNELNNVIITRVTFKLNKTFIPNIEYAGIKEALDSKEINLVNVRNAIINVRKAKLPDLTQEPNAGSFFKNPLVEKEVYLSIQKKYNNVPAYEVMGKYKVPAGWLIEQAGFKGYVFNNVCGVSKKHALVLVNLNNANGTDILNLCQKIKTEVYKMFNIQLEEEVIIV